MRDPSKFVATTGSPLGTWMDFYEGGWQTVFPAGGFPSSYGGADLGLHAEASMAPWDCRIVDDAPDKVSIRCSIRTARLPFYFEKTLTLKAGSPMLEVDEFLINEGRETVPCVWGEHIAIGAPTLSGDSVIDLPGGTLLNHPGHRGPERAPEAGLPGLLAVDRRQGRQPRRPEQGAAAQH